MIFPIPAIFRETMWVQCDIENPDHRKHLDVGDKEFLETTEIHGTAIEHMKFRVLEDSLVDGKNVKVEVDREFVLMTLDAGDGESQIMYFNMSNVFYKTADVHKSIKRGLQCK